ncbi:hypothetical protein NBRC3280_3469 [Acetobacter pasteurianus NBRC 3280]|uniref:Uncharacterized protein n=1 Tax=Acetobacter pasteurianus NBRC 3278 TaxID=1226660 RepID=A0A401X9C9_ACEPA|nr:hypothetical protein [Acetobacter pasteurianus]GCD60899.1 hypothetical protein NBRC3277_3474 [Acetobacter pasteurianus NBRC 3277]GCD64492.1 hypothetical protein NBRC3278_3585 [Acetobacter pasteurianus NBRC 3278]GCD70834.1 hypothetical protein NBRC3280_3469 [Acetobacter pasteurianus NBRC 3280]
MTQKLKILGPYTPEHEGPYAFNGEVCVVHAVLGQLAFISRPESNEGFIACLLDIKNAEEVPQPREFWFNEYLRAGGSAVLSFVHETETKATNERADYPTLNWIKTIHVREVLPGEGE